MAPRCSAGRAVAGVAAVAAVLAGAPVSSASTAPERLCTVADERLAELSGLASDGRSLYAVNDGGSQVEVFVLDRYCAVGRTITADVDPFDVEDVARAPDGTLWLADTGDNRKQRDTVALLEVPAGGGASVYRLTYPDGAHDAEALLLDRSGVPYIVTKNVLGMAGVYRPAGPLRSPGPTPMEQVAEVKISATGTEGGPVGVAGSVLVTGGAVSANGKVIALRTYTDAYLYSVTDGDIVAALAREPVRIPLPDEGQGEAIAFDPNGSLLSAGEGAGQPISVVPGAAAKAKPPRTTEPRTDSGGDGSAGAATGPGATAAAGEREGPGLPALPGLVVALGVVIAFWFGLRKLRRR